MANEVVTMVDSGCNYSFGRSRVYSSVQAVTLDNVVEFAKAAIAAYSLNAAEIDRLYHIYRGRDNAILLRKKQVRPEVNNKVVVNYASRIAKFKVSYFLSDPVVLVNEGKSERTEDITTLNKFNKLARKPAKDKQITESFMICGIGYRFIESDKDYPADGHAPYKITTLDPQNTLLVYNSDVDDEPMAGIYITDVPADTVGTADITGEKQAGQLVQKVTVWTPDAEYTIIDGKPTKNPSLGFIPIVEYRANQFYLGSFEQAEPILVAISKLASDRLNATEQNVHSILFTKGIEFSEEMKAAFKGDARVSVENAENGKDISMEYVSPPLNQADQQVQIDSLTDAMLTVACVPSNFMVGGSGNNGAALASTGWLSAELDAKDSEAYFVESAMRELAIELQICRNLGQLPDLKLEDVGVKFTRRQYDDLLVKSQTFQTLCANPYVDPRDAWNISNISYDPDAMYQRGLAWYEKQQAEAAKLEAMKLEAEAQRTAALRQEGDPAPEQAEPENKEVAKPEQKGLK